MAGIITNRPWQGGARERSCPPVRLSGRATLRRPDGPRMSGWPLSPMPGEGYWPEALVARGDTLRQQLGSQPLLLVEDMPPEEYKISLRSSYQPSPGVQGVSVGDPPHYFFGYNLAPVVVRIEFSLPGGETQILEVDPDCEVSVIASSVRVTCAWEQVRAPNPAVDFFIPPPTDPDDYQPYIYLPVCPLSVDVSCMLAPSSGESRLLAPRSVWHAFPAFDLPGDTVKTVDWGIVPPGARQVIFTNLPNEASTGNLWWGNYLSYEIFSYSQELDLLYSNPPTSPPFPVQGLREVISYNRIAGMAPAGSGPVRQSFELSGARSWRMHRRDTQQLEQQAQLRAYRAVYYVS